MNWSKRALLAAVVAVGVAGASALPASAGGKDPLFINLTSDDAHRIDMAFAFGRGQHGLGHPLTVFLNDRAVLAASKTNEGKFADQQKAIAAFVAKGITVIVCPMCMQHYGIRPEDLLPGLKVGNPELTGKALFRRNTKTMAW